MAKRYLFLMVAFLVFGNLFSSRFSAQAVNVSITGQVNGDSTDDITLSCGNYRVTTDHSGYYIFSSIPDGTCCNITPINSDYEFYPEYRPQCVSTEDLINMNFASTFISHNDYDDDDDDGDVVEKREKEAFSESSGSKGSVSSTDLDSFIENLPVLSTSISASSGSSGSNSSSGSSSKSNSKGANANFANSAGSSSSSNTTSSSSSSSSVNSSSNTGSTSDNNSEATRNSNNNESGDASTTERNVNSANSSGVFGSFAPRTGLPEWMIISIAIALGAAGVVVFMRSKKETY